MLEIWLAFSKLNTLQHLSESLLPIIGKQPTRGKLHAGFPTRLARSGQLNQQAKRALCGCGILPQKQWPPFLIAWLRHPADHVAAASCRRSSGLWSPPPITWLRHPAAEAAACGRHLSVLRALIRGVLLHYFTAARCRSHGSLCPTSLRQDAAVTVVRQDAAVTVARRDAAVTIERQEVEVTAPSYRRGLPGAAARSVFAG